MTVRRKLWFVLLAALAQGAVGAGLGLTTGWNSGSWPRFLLAGFLAWFTCSLLLWMPLAGFTKRLSRWQGIFSGAGAGLLAFPAVLFLLDLFWRSTPLPDNRTDILLFLFQMLVTDTAVSIIPLATLGWISIPLGAFIAGAWLDQ
jgi:hypothetical protein